MAPSDPDDGFDEAIRRFRHEQRELDDEVAAESKQLERSRRTLNEAILELAERGEALRVAVGPHSWTGQVVHVTSQLLILRSPGDLEIDVALDAITSIRVTSASAAADARPAANAPGSLLARLRELTATGDEVELGGPLLAPTITGQVTAVALAHIEVRGRDGGELVLPLAEVGFLIRQPRRR